MIAIKERLFFHFRNSSFILAVVFATLIGVAFIVTWSVMGYFTVQYQYDLLDDEMREIVSSNFSSDGEPHSKSKLVRIVADRSHTQIPTGPYVYLLWDADRFNANWLAGNLLSKPEFDYDKYGRGRFKVSYEGDLYEYYGRAIRIYDTYVLLVGRKFTTNAFLDKPIYWTLFALFMIMLSIWGSRIFSRYLARRMQDFNTTISDVMDGTDLGERIPLEQREDQIEKTAKLFNEMLDRIQTNAQHSKLATQEIAHRIMSDVWSVESHIHQMKRAIEKSDDNRRLADTVTAAADAVINLRTGIDGLYELLCIKNEPVVKVEITLRDLIEKCQMNDAESEFWQLAAEKGIQVEIDEEAFDSRIILASEVHLKTAISNLLANAAKYTPDDGRIMICVEHDARGMTIVVSNSGNGIKAEDRERATKAFIRLNQGQPGAGMGLHIVSDIANAHRVDLILEDESPGEIEPGLRVKLGPFLMPDRR
ncbi:MAG: HAMP domain-containing sensor histidine kinase [Acidiferrobacterales bacterium]|nr:HAMP domain-containing sensor histidine kinase [Acidiferrobacterales bacterium]